MGGQGGGQAGPRRVLRRLDAPAVVVALYRYAGYCACSLLTHAQLESMQ